MAYFTYNGPFCQHLAFFLAWARIKICNGSDGEESLLQGAFSLKKIRNLGAVGRITCKFTVTSKPKRILHEKTQGKWTPQLRQDSYEAHFLWKKQGMWRRSAASHTNTVTLKARRVLTWENTWNVKGLLRRVFSLKKDTESGSGWPHHM